MKIASSAWNFLLKLTFSIVYIIGVMSLFDIIFPRGFASNYLELMIIMPLLIIGVRFIYRPFKRH